ncbi:hypothetical protein VDGL01_12563 [Verticillium dahliae]
MLVDQVRWPLSPAYPLGMPIRVHAAMLVENGASGPASSRGPPPPVLTTLRLLDFGPQRASICQPSTSDELLLRSNHPASD